MRAHVHAGCILRGSQNLHVQCHVHVPHDALLNINFIKTEFLMICTFLTKCTYFEHFGY